MNHHRTDHQALVDQAGGDASPTPLQLLTTALSVVFLSDVLVVLVSSRLPPLPGWFTAVQQSLLMIVLAVPALYVLVYRPMNREYARRTRTLAALRESEFFFRESQRAAFLGSYTVDFVAGVWDSSEVLDHIFGIRRDFDRTVEGWLEIVHPDDLEMMNRYLREEVLLKGQPFNKEYRIVRKSDGTIRWVSGRGDLNFDADDHVISMFGTIQDITERKELEAALAALKSLGGSTSTCTCWEKIHNDSEA